MPITVKELFDSVGKEIMGQVKWNERLTVVYQGYTVLLYQARKMH